jgi:hypothetical protein
VILTAQPISCADMTQCPHEPMGREMIQMKFHKFLSISTNYEEDCTLYANYFNGD